ncbi:hypothetical protein DLE54_02650 [Psychrobacter sp. YP14]|uniref:hypothetical protein n=1 Tax=Psychrobacter sp. YP14 TaxID=2203895 RepID=UPI000D7E5CED|nr:hypothetical protein [Psychrobacter sp. YP14]AWT48542.1 hypothetical protein DLE54_02650 [Psychrobacter sp. YP14]
MKLFSKIALATATLSIASVASAASISGSTDFRVTLPEILVLYHWDDAHLKLTNTDNFVVGDEPTRELVAPIGSSSYSIIGDKVNATSAHTQRHGNNTINVTLKDAWAVRSLSSAPVALKVETKNPTLTNVSTPASGSTIAVSAATLKSTNQVLTNENTAEVKIPSGWTPVLGDIDFNLNLANANHSGEYTSHGATGRAAAAATTDTFLLTLTGN